MTGCGCCWSARASSSGTRLRRPSGSAGSTAEYRRTFDRLRMDEDEAREVVTSALRTALRLGVKTDADQVADALKECVVLADDREGGEVEARPALVAAVSDLWSGGSPVSRREVAVRLFGTSGEVLHDVLADLDLWRPRRPSSRSGSEVEVSDVE
jgi:hypothetical protein